MSWNPNAQFPWSMPTGTDFSGMNYGGAPQQPGSGVYGPNGGLDFKLGMNAPTFQLGMQGIGTLGNLWGAWQSSKLAKDQLNFTKSMANANLNNQIKSYNTALEDRSRSRAVAEGQTSAEAQAYVDRNRLSR